jgi:hypothetical protein
LNPVRIAVAVETGASMVRSPVACRGPDPSKRPNVMVLRSICTIPTSLVAVFVVGLVVPGRPPLG